MNNEADSVINPSGTRNKPDSDARSAIEALETPAGETPPGAEVRRRVPSQPVLPPARMPPALALNRLFQPACNPDDRSRGWRAWWTLLAPRGASVAGGEERAELVMRVGRAQAFVAALAALLAAGRALDGHTDALWPLILAVLAGGGAALAGTLQRRGETLLLASLALLGSQLGMLAWALDLDGPRAALLAVVPALAVLALRLGSRTLAILTTALALALYLASALMQAQGLWTPTLLVSDATQTLVDAALVVAGLALSVAAILDLHAGWARSRHEARLRLRDAHDLHASYELLEARVRTDAELLHRALAAALRGHGGDLVAPLVADLALHRLATLIDATAARLQTLRYDREDRLRLEGAIRRLTLAAGQVDLGGAPAWPEVSGTALDSLVERLRAMQSSSVSADSLSTRAGVPDAHLASIGADLRAASDRATGVMLSWWTARFDERGAMQAPAPWSAWEFAPATEDDVALE